jgi:hypothetical protein
MIGYILTNQQYNNIQGVYYSEYQFFNCVQDINGIWFLFLSDEDKTEVAATQYAYILNLPTGQYTPPIPPPIPQTI